MDLKNLKNLKELILANLLNGSLTERDLDGLAAISNLVKEQGIDVFVKLPDENKISTARSLDYARRFMGNGATAFQVNELGVQLDAFFADETIPRTREYKIQLIKKARELSGIGLADAKNMVEEAFGI